MRFRFVSQRSCKVKTLLKEQGISRGLLTKIKFHGGALFVNERAVTAVHVLEAGDVLEVIIPDEAPYDKLRPVAHSLAIVHEDEHFLLLNKPAGYASIPSRNHDKTMANFVKHYYQSKDYPNQLIHIVTRLDRDTSGLMLLAKHGYAHARLDKQLQAKSLEKEYYALVSGKGQLASCGEIVAPIARAKDSIITRRVHDSGKYARTSYRLVASYGDVHLLAIRLHTGRTHQIRVHFAHLGFPLLGDDLYGGDMTRGIKRQALHCYRIAYDDPFSGVRFSKEIGLTDDLEEVILELRKK